MNSSTVSRVLPVIAIHNLLTVQIPCLLGN